MKILIEQLTKNKFVKKSMVLKPREIPPSMLLDYNVNLLLLLQSLIF